MSVIIEDHSDEVLTALEAAKQRGLEKIGLLAEGYAKKLCPVDTGKLRNSITHEVDGDDVYIGTNTEYGPYVELGTGIYYPGGGRKTPWFYEDDKGKGHITSGSPPQPFLKPAATEHTDTYLKALEKELTNA